MHAFRRAVAQRDVMYACARGMRVAPVAQLPIMAVPQRAWPSARAARVPVAVEHRLPSTHALAAAAAAVSSSGAAVTTAAVGAGAVAPTVPFGQYIGEPYMINVAGVFPNYAHAKTAMDDSYLLWIFQYPMYFMVEQMGVPWWGAVVGTAALFRLLAARWMFQSIVQGAKLQKYMPDMKGFQARVAEARASGSIEQQQEAVKDMRAFMSAKGLGNPLMLMLKSLGQLPLTIGFFVGIRRLVSDAHLIPSLAATATAPSSVLPALLWFPDPTWIIPLAAASATMANLFVNKAMQGFPQMDLTRSGQRALFGGMTLIFLPVGLQLPLALQLYGLTTASIMLAQSALLNIKDFRDYIGLPPEWPMRPTADQKWAEPVRAIGRFFSKLGEFDIKGAFSPHAGSGPDQRYVSAFGLKEATPPPPPEVLLTAAAPGMASSAAASAAAAAAAVGTVKYTPATATPAAGAAPAAAAAAGKPLAATPTHTVRLSKAPPKRK